MIVGLGVDLVPVARVAAILARPWGERFERRIFTEDERRYCRGRGDPAQHYAARFAAKEAALKALGVPEGLSWHELEVRADAAAGAPRLALAGAAAAAAAGKGAGRTHLSLTHAGGMAAAVVILEA
jgi:holo-[acyl-carrier protein] synthase